MLQGPGVDPSQVASDVATQVDPQRRFIRTAQAQFQVKDVYRTALAIEDEVASQGGFVVDNEISSQVQRVLSRPLAPGKRLELRRAWRMARIMAGCFLVRAQLGRSWVIGA